MATVKLGVDFDVRSGSRKLEADLKRISKIKLRLDPKGFTQPLGRITGDLSEFQKSLDASNARVLAFAASAGILYKLTQAFDFLVKSTVNVEKQLKDINVVLGASDKNLKRFGDRLFQIAAQTGQSFKVVAESATEFSRQGLGMEKTLRRTADAMVLARLSGMEVVDATNALTAAVNSFSAAALNTNQIVNKMAAVDAAFAVSSNDLAEALKRSAASAQAAGVSLDELLALTTAVQERTARGGAVIGNSFKTIFTRIQRPEVLNQLKQLNIQVFDLYGNTLPAIKIMQNFANQFDKLSQAQQANTSELVGGVFQVNNLKAALADLGSEYSKYNQAVQISTKASNEANRRNLELNKTLSAQFNKLQNQATQIAAGSGELILRPTVERGLDFSKMIFGDLDTGESGVFGKTGESIGKAVLGGIGQFLSGPGLAIGSIIVGKLLKDFIVFSKKALGDLTAIGGQSTHIRNTESQIKDILQRNLTLVNQIRQGTVSRAAVEKQIEMSLREQAAIQRQITTSSAMMAPNVARSIPRGRGKASGHIPAFSHGFVPAGAAAGEIAGAYASGYTPGRVRSTTVPGIGKVVYNSREKIKHYPGLSQPAIVPPASSKAGVRYAREFKKTHGFTPAARGFNPADYSGARSLGAFQTDSIRSLTAGGPYGRTPRGTFAAAPIRHAKPMAGGGFTDAPADAALRAKVRLAYEKMLKFTEQNGRSVERETRIREALQKKYRLADSTMTKLNQAYEKEVRAAEIRGRSARAAAEAQQRAATQAEELKQQKATARQAKFQNVAMVSAIVGPMVIEGIKNAVERDVTSGADAAFNERSTAGANMASQMLSMGTIGFSMGGPYGAAAGAAIGGLMTIGPLIKSFSDRTTELDTNLKLVTDRFQEITSASANLEKGLQDVKRAFENPDDVEGGARVINEFMNSLSNVKGMTAESKRQVKMQLENYFQSFVNEDPTKRKEAMTAMFGDKNSPGIMGQIRNEALVEQNRGQVVRDLYDLAKRTDDEFQGFFRGRLNFENIDRTEFSAKQKREEKEFFDKSVSQFLAAPSREKGLTVRDLMVKEGKTSIGRTGQEFYKNMLDLLDEEIKEEFAKDEGFDISGARGFYGGVIRQAKLPGFFNIPMDGKGMPIQALDNSKGVLDTPPPMEEAIKRADEFFQLFVTLKDALDQRRGQDRMTTEEFSKLITGTLEEYKKHVDQFSIGLTMFTSAQKLISSSFSRNANAALDIASMTADPRSVAAARARIGEQNAQFGQTQRITSLTRKLFQTQNLGTGVVESLRPFVEGNRMEQLIPAGDKFDQQKVISGFKALVNLAPLRQGSKMTISDLGYLQSEATGLEANQNFFDKNFAGTNIIRGATALGIDKDKDFKTDAENIALALTAMGQTDAGNKILQEANKHKNEEVSILQELIKANEAGVEAANKFSDGLINELNKIREANRIAFAGGISAFEGSSATQRVANFTGRAGIMQGNFGSRAKGMAALGNLQQYAEVARILGPERMSTDVLNRVGRTDFINAQARELDRVTRGMGLEFQQSDLRSIAATQIDELIKPTRELTDIIPPIDSIESAINDIHNHGVKIENVQEMANKIAEAVKVMREGGSLPPTPKPSYGSGSPKTRKPGKGTGNLAPVEINADGGIEVKEVDPPRFPMLRAGAEGFFKGGGSIDDQFNNFGKLMTELGDDLRTGFKGALKEAIFEAESFSDALRSMTVSVLDTLADKIFSMAIDSMFNAVGTKVLGNKGGYVTNSGIQRFARGGMVQGGSGFRDDVPAMLSRGEFVVRKSAVDKYGSGFLNALNMAGGGAVISASNRIIANHPRRPTDFKYNFSPNLSSLAITDESRKDVASRRKLADKIFRNRAQYQREMHAYKQQQRGRLIQGYMSAAMTMGSYAMNYGFNNPTIDPSTGMIMGTELPATGGPYGTGAASYANRGGFISKFANGGYVDDVPALLMGGEMVMNRDAVNKHGRGFFEKLNRGSLEGMAEGGMVGGFSTGSSSGSGDSVVQLFDRLISSNESLASVIEESNKTGGATGTGSSANNNVTINVNIDKSGVKSDSQTSSENNTANASGGMKADEEKAARMGEEIRMACLDVIINEKRPGGALSDFGVGGR